MLLIGTCELAIVYNYNTASESSNVPRTYGTHQPQSKIEAVLYHGTISGTSGGTPTPPNTRINLFVLLISTNIGMFLLEWEAMSMDVVRCNTPGHVVSLFASRIKKNLVIHPTVRVKDSGTSNKARRGTRVMGTFARMLAWCFRVHSCGCGRRRQAVPLADGTSEGDKKLKRRLRRDLFK